LDLPSIDQCDQYVPRLERSNEPIKRLVALVQAPDTSFEKRYKKASPKLGGILTAYNWSEFLLSCVQLMKTYEAATTEGQAVRWFYNFLDQEYRMKAFTTEVWIVPTSSEPLWPGVVLPLPAVALASTFCQSTSSLPLFTFTHGAAAW